MQLDLEDSIRFVSQVLGYSDPLSIWKMDCFEFFRDLVRAHKIQQQQLEQLKKMEDGKRK